MKKFNVRILLSFLLCSGFGLWWYGLHRIGFPGFDPGSRLSTSLLEAGKQSPSPLYRCEKCGTPTALNAPEGNLCDVDKTNNADNFHPVITSVTPDMFVPIIETTRLRFRRMNNDDLQRLHTMYSRTEVAQSNTWQPYETIADTQKMLDESISDYRKGKKAAWIVEEKHSGEMVGTARFVMWYPRDQRAVLGWSIDSPYWGYGYGTECARMLIEYGAKYLNINRMQAIVRLDNAASRRVAIKAGMSHHARLRDHWFLKGEWLTFDQYAILRSEIAHKLGMDPGLNPGSSNRPLEGPLDAQEHDKNKHTVSSHRCRLCNPHKPLGCHDGTAGDAPDENYKNYRPVITKHFDGEYIRCFETKQLRVRELTLQDLGPLHDLLSNSNTMARTTFPLHTSKSQTRALLKKWRTGYSKGYTVPWGVALKKTGKLIGIGGFSGWYPDGQRCFIAYTMDHRLTGHQYQTELIQGLIEFGFVEMKFRRVEILVRSSDNVGIAAAAEAGMSHEGTQREYKKVDHQFVDLELFGILKRQALRGSATTQHVL
ncbi:MAG: GNAT family N-acetyltransferase [Candidatus Dependentiae bacterium]|jgi:ribosomal-protein-alanine N-acetyltransferase